MEYIIAKKEDIELVMESRLQMLKIVNGLSAEYVFDAKLIKNSREYFEKENQTTVLVVDHKDSKDRKVLGCATMCYIDLMPTFSHPTGKRAHLMNVYTDSQYRRQGIAFKMVRMLMQEAKKKGVTEISLDATEMGRPLYEKLGFQQSGECMVYIL